MVKQTISTGKSGIYKNYQLLPNCSKYAKDLIIVATCDGASSTGQVGNEVARKLSKTFPDKVRMCCLAAVAAGSDLHLRIFRDAKAVIAINGCPLQCASKVLRNNGIEPDYEIVISKEGVNKLPTLDFTEEDVEKVSKKIVKEFLAKFMGEK
jgi:uncharacterized metal-binding protein